MPQYFTYFDSNDYFLEIRFRNILSSLRVVTKNLTKSTIEFYLAQRKI